MLRTADGIGSVSKRSDTLHYITELRPHDSRTSQMGPLDTCIHMYMYIYMHIVRALFREIIIQGRGFLPWTRATYWFLVGTRRTYSSELNTLGKIISFVSRPWLRVLIGCCTERILPGFGSKLQMILSFVLQKPKGKM